MKLPKKIDKHGKKDTPLRVFTQQIYPVLFKCTSYCMG